jgi:hypothetical protein
MWTVICLLGLPHGNSGGSGRGPRGAWGDGKPESTSRLVLAPKSYNKNLRWLSIIFLLENSRNWSILNKLSFGGCFTTAWSQIANVQIIQNLNRRNVKMHDFLKIPPPATTTTSHHHMPSLCYRPCLQKRLEPIRALTRLLGDVLQTGDLGESRGPRGLLIYAKNLDSSSTHARNNMLYSASLIELHNISYHTINIM